MIVRRVATVDAERLAETPASSWREAYRGLLPDWRLGSESAERGAARSLCECWRRRCRRLSRLSTERRGRAVLV